MGFAKLQSKPSFLQKFQGIVCSPFPGGCKYPVICSFKPASKPAVSASSNLILTLCFHHQTSFSDPHPPFSYNKPHLDNPERASHLKILGPVSKVPLKGKYSQVLQTGTWPSLGGHDSVYHIPQWSCHENKQTKIAHAGCGQRVGLVQVTFLETPLLQKPSRALS